MDAEWAGFNLPMGTACTRQTQFYWVVLPENEGSGKPLSLKDGVWTMPLWAQCGGTGGTCGDIPEKPCSDTPWPKAVCQPATRCERQNTYYYMCSPYEAGEPEASDGKTVKTLPLYGACGGIGSDCKAFEWCMDAPYPGYTCPPGASCTRLSEYFWGCYADKGANSGSDTKPSGSGGRKLAGAWPRLRGW